jgi:prepilin-type N-terminal cleavage/methylation domain-containing protein
MNKLIKQAFTLIELLVVIAIIGILSGLIVVSMSGVTQKANIAKAQVFSNSLRNALLLNLVAEYKLDGSGNDSWGAHNGTIIGTTTLSSDCVYGTCLSLNGSTYISIPDDDAVFNFGSRMTAMMWVKGLPQTGRMIFGQYDTTDQAWRLYTGEASPYNQLRLTINSSPTLQKRCTTNAVVFDNNWHLIGFTYNDSFPNVYIDGQLASLTINQYDSFIGMKNSAANLTFGSQLTSGSPNTYFNGFIDEARIYNTVISASQIKEQYYVGLNSLLINGGISKDEYAKRMVGLIVAQN